MSILDSLKGSDGKKELSMEMRLLIAFVLVMLLLLVAPFFTGSPGPKGPSNVTPQKAEEVTKPPASPPPAEAPKVAAAEAAAPTAPAAPVQAAKAEDIILETKLFKVKFSNKGAIVSSWILKEYKDLNGKQLELVDQTALGKGLAAFAVEFKDPQGKPDLNAQLFVASRTPDNLGVDFEFSGSGVSAKKSFRFLDDSYLVKVSSDITGAGSHLLTWRGGFGDSTVANPATVGRTLYYDTAQGRLLTKTAKDAKGNPVSVSGPFSFAGLEDPYFAAVFLPQGTGTTELKTYSDPIPFGPDKKEEPFVGAGVGSELNHYSVFVGPKDSDILRKVDPKLEQLIDFGRWFGFIAKPLFLALNYVNDRLVHNFGWSIVVVTVLINMVLLPLRLSSMKSAKKMQGLQPQIKAINEKYKGYGLRDPRQQQKNQEMMDLYKKYGVNPLGGCFPMLLQLPFFIAFYTVLTVTIELRGANWLWVSDLSRPEQLAIRILPIVMIVTQFISQKMTPPSPGADPAQQKMMMIMPLVLGFMFYYASSGLVLYWLTGNLVGIAQQWLTNRTTAAPVIDVKPVSKKKK